MAVLVCPAAQVEAPVEAVWQCLIDPERYGRWVDGHVLAVDPPGTARPGQQVLLQSGGFRVTMTIREVDTERHVLSLTMRLPLGMVEESRISCAPLDGTSCRLQYG